MFKEFRPGSAEVDWCENNYSIVPFIAEFYNTISNALFFVLPPLMWAMFKEYARRVNPTINLMWFLFMVVGACSAYFHSTLSLVGQLLDEVAILWALSLAAALWFPRRLYPQMLKGNRKLFRGLVVILMAFGTIVAFIKPWLNSFLLMAFIIPGLWTAQLELKRMHCVNVIHLSRVCTLLWVVSISVWIADRTLCDLWRLLSFPYLHSIWHIFVLASSYYSVVLFAYFDAVNECPETGPVLRCWPRDRYTNFGVPYVALSKTKPKTVL